MAKRRITNRSADIPAAEEVREFRAAVRDVKPLAHAVPMKAAPKPRPRASVRDRALPSALPEAASESLGDMPSDTAMAAADILSFQRPGVRAQTVRRLRRGLMPIEDELDLHGQSQTAAREQLADFLALSHDAGRRCVRIIHGKGLRSGARGPVLKAAVDAWLRRHASVLAFTSAKAIDGGTGAVYVLLRS